LSLPHVTVVSATCHWSLAPSDLSGILKLTTVRAQGNWSSAAGLWRAHPSQQCSGSILHTRFSLSSNMCHVSTVPSPTVSLGRVTSEYTPSNNGETTSPGLKSSPRCPVVRNRHCACSHAHPHPHPHTHVHAHAYTHARTHKDLESAGGGMRGELALDLTVHVRHGHGSHSHACNKVGR
jgi:hypothetical protein